MKDNLHKQIEDILKNQALSQINTSLIADEVLRVVVEKIDKMKGLGNYGQGCTDPIEWNIGYNQAIKDLLSNLSNNKENENNG